MRHRCLYEWTAAFHRYGGRGITISKEWEDDFWTFVSDMGPKPSPEHFLDRIDNDKGYSKQNCRWATRSEQNNNRSNTILVTYKGETRSLTLVARELGLSRSAVYARVRYGGMTPEEAISIPLMKQKRTFAKATP